MADLRQERIKALFLAASERELPERSAYLDEQCGADAALRSAVESLLAAGEEGGSFLEGPPRLSTDNLASRDRLADATTLDSPSGQPLQIIDRYRLLERIGEGGMGEVWLAEQNEPVRRRVALKLIKAGMDTGQVMARFEAERQALALMDHPAIAKMFDAGTTAEGRPYFVMEYVPGEPITKHCDERRLGIVERLELFVQVCEAVQHAHRKAVLHRDLKPSNVLVASEDGRSVPKIIDFGVAKAMSQPLTERTLYTGLGLMIGTPGYMSPEQADPTGQGVDTRTDVYSLGVMLYELLVGVPPFDQDKVRRAGWEGLGKLLREQEPAIPSRRLSTLPPAASEESSSRRQTKVPALRSRLSGDLDWITMKAIEADRERRYGSPAELAEDIRRHLRDEPVLAASPGAVYRMRKFVRRHRLGVAASGIVALLVAAGLVGTTVGLVRARRAESEARKQAETSERVSGFLSNLLASVDPERMGKTLVTDLRERVAKAERGRGGSEPQVAARLSSFDTSMRGVNSVDAARSLMDQEILGPAGKTIDEEMSDEPLLAARLHATLGLTYTEFGLLTAAKEHHLKALEARRRLLGASHPETLRSMSQLGRIYQGRSADAELLLRDSMDAQRRVLGEGSRDALQSAVGLAKAIQSQGRYKEAEELFRETLETQRRVLGADDPDVAATTRDLADCIVEPFRFQGSPEAERRLAEAEALYRDALERQRRSLGADDRRTLLTLNNLANAYMLQRRYREAGTLYLEVVEATRRTLGDDHIRTAAMKANLGGAYHMQGRHEEAERFYREAIDTLRRVGSVNISAALYSLARLYLEQGRHDEARRLYDEAIAELTRTVGPAHPQTISYIKALAEINQRQRRYDEAGRLHGMVLDASRRAFGETDPRTLASLKSLVEVHLASGHPGQARTDLRALLVARKRAAEGEDADASARNAYARELLTCEPADMRNPQEALEVARDAADATAHKDAGILDTLALAYHMTSHHEEAVQTQRQALDLLPDGASPTRDKLEKSLAAYEAALRRP